MAISQVSQIARTERTLADAERDILLLSGELSVLQAELRSNREAMVLAREVMEAKLTATSTVLETRLSHLNALRDSYEIKSLEWEKKSSTFFTKEAHELYIKVIDTDMRIIRDWMNRQEGKATQSQFYWAIGVGLMGMIISFLAVIVQLVHSTKP